MLSMSVFLLTLFSFKAAVAAEEPAGQKIYIKQKCSQCHPIEALKIAKVESDEEEAEEADEEKVDPPDLSGVGKERTAEWIVKWEKKEEQIKGRKHKKKYKGTDEELKTLAEWLATLKFDVPKKKAK